jgi:hypothetical protein
MKTTQKIDPSFTKREIAKAREEVNELKKTESGLRYIDGRSDEEMINHFLWMDDNDEK